MRGGRILPRLVFGDWGREYSAGEFSSNIVRVVGVRTVIGFGMFSESSDLHPRCIDGDESHCQRAPHQANHSHLQVQKPTLSVC